jgi:hypothetical protein
MGLWELVIEARSLNERAADEEAVAAARDAVASLLSRGLIYVCWFTHSSNEEEKVPPARALELIADTAAWQSPEWGSKYLAVAATKRGEAALRR